MADESGRRRKKPANGKGRRKRRRVPPQGRCQPRSEQDLLAGLRHRSRREVLRRLHRADEPMSPAEMSRLLDVRVTGLSYHVNVLEKYRMVKLVEEELVRGAVEHFYESKVADDSLVLEILRKTRAEDEGKERA